MVSPDPYKILNWNFQDYHILYIVTTWQSFSKFWDGSCPNPKYLVPFGVEWSNAEFSLFRIFLYSDWIRRFTRKSPYSVRTQENRNQKKLCILTLFTVFRGTRENSPNQKIIPPNREKKGFNRSFWEYSLQASWALLMTLNSVLIE